jgi:uncharacterized membrane protein (DUF2068 family)
MQRPLDPGIRLIALFELAKGTAVLVLALGVLSLLNQDVGDTLTRWIEHLRVDPNNRYIHGLLEKITNLDRRQLEAISFGSFFYAALRFLEGIGLLMRKRWAAWVTVIGTAAFIPLEVWELIRRASAGRFVIVVFNGAVLGYLIYRLRREHRLDEKAAPRERGKLRPPAPRGRRSESGSGPFTGPLRLQVRGDRP